MTDSKVANIRAVALAVLAALATALADNGVTALEAVVVATAAVTAWGSGPVVRVARAKAAERRYRHVG